MLCPLMQDRWLLQGGELAALGRKRGSRQGNAGCKPKRRSPGCCDASRTENFSTSRLMGQADAEIAVRWIVCEPCGLGRPRKSSGGWSVPGHRFRASSRAQVRAGETVRRTRAVESADFVCGQWFFQPETLRGGAAQFQDKRKQLLAFDMFGNARNAKDLA